MPLSLGAEMWGPVAWLLLLLLASFTGRTCFRTLVPEPKPTRHTHTHASTRVHTYTFPFLCSELRNRPPSRISSCYSALRRATRALLFHAPFQPQARSLGLGSLTTLAKRLELPLGKEMW